MPSRKGPRDRPDVLEMMLEGFRVQPGEGDFRTVTLDTSRGAIECRWCLAEGARAGAILVGGVGGGFDTPCRGRLYPELCEELPARGVAALRVRYRNPTDLAEATLDVLAGLEFLRQQGVEAAVLVGHSFGGAVVIRAAAASDVVLGVVALSTQSYGAEPAAALGPRCALLLAHGTDDEILSPDCSRFVHGLSRQPKQLVLLEGARHGLDEAAEEVHRLVRDWIVETLRPLGGG